MNEGLANMLIGIEGGLGSGKTIDLTRYLIKDKMNGFSILANYPLYDIPFTFIEFDDLLDFANNSMTLRNKTIGIDEITVYIDCRCSGTKRNRLFSYLVLQSRKRNTNIYYTTQNFSMCERRLIEHTQIKVVCEKIFDNYGNEIDDIRKITTIDIRNPNDIKVNSFLLDISKYYPYFDTDTIIVPPTTKLKIN
jgi:hypothetical protein